MVRIQLLSDLHLETPRAYDIFEVPPKAPYLALLGDIGYAVEHRVEYEAFLRRLLSKFRIVFLVLGNHEPWHASWERAREVLGEFERGVRGEREREGGLGEFVLLDRRRYDFPGDDGDGNEDEGDGDGAGGGVTILGCTLFSRVSTPQAEDISFGIQDFYKIDNWTVEQHTKCFDDDLAWLNEQVKSLEKEGGGGNGNGNRKGDRRVVILTHYSPTLDERALDPRHGTSRLTAGFASELKGERCFGGGGGSGMVKVWAWGHTHFNCDFLVEGGGDGDGDEDEDVKGDKDGNEGRAKTKATMRLVTNQRGYYFAQADGFDVGRVLEI
ncbi:Ser/Thr protein phosphatase superfamily [Astrocystis sublimbata]|nr:Ser/Thr protein phosphatase superfamily [Astrocystis sublimbata]